MLVQCTKKLLDELKIKPEMVNEEKPLFSWHANLIIVKRRKTIVLVNDSSHYIIVLYGLKAKDFKNLDKIILDSIRASLLDECIKEEIVDEFLNYSPDFIYTKTKDRSSVAKLNKACEIIYFYEDALNLNYINQSDVSIRASALIIGDIYGKYVYPNEVMYSDLESFAQETIFSCKSVELKVTLDLLHHKVWRRIIVPVNISFKKLHDILQIVFSWQDYHLHEFYIFDGNKPIVNLVCSEDAFEYSNNVPMLLDKDIKLSDYISKCSMIEYNYDFGDNWQHFIEIEKIIEDYGQNYPICLCGEGNTPPEDVGGESGYDVFLEAICDENNPEHSDMVKWRNMQNYKDFDIEIVNSRLKNTLKGFTEN